MCKVGSPCVSTAGFCVRRCSLRIHCSLQGKTLSQHGELYWQDTRSQGSKYKSSALMAWIRAQPRHKAKALNDVVGSRARLYAAGHRAQPCTLRELPPAAQCWECSASAACACISRVLHKAVQGHACRPVASSRCDGSTTVANISQSSQS